MPKVPWFNEERRYMSPPLCLNSHLVEQIDYLVMVERFETKKVPSVLKSLSVEPLHLARALGLISGLNAFVPAASALLASCAIRLKR